MSFLVIIRHNLDCGTRCNALQIIRTAGQQPVIIDALLTGWTRPHSQAHFAGANLAPHQALRVDRSPVEVMERTAPVASDDAPLAAMVAQPNCIIHPFVCSPKGVRFCPPSKAILERLDRLPPGPLVNGDGQIIIDVEGNRLV